MSKWTISPALTLCLTLAPCHPTAGEPLAGTEYLETRGDLAEQMVAGIDRYLMNELAASPAHRDRPTRERLRRIIGAVDPRVSPATLEYVGTFTSPSLIARGSRYEVHAVRWPALQGVDAEGLLIEPKGEPAAQVIVLPDADTRPEDIVLPNRGAEDQLQVARRLAEYGCRVLVPVLISRSDTFSGHPDVAYTNQPHREFIYRAAYEQGRHIIGYEVQKTLTAVDWFIERDGNLPVGVFGYGEGGLIALHSAALDERIDAAVISGYVKPREDVWREPIYRNVWSQLRAFGDAELLGMIAPRAVIVEACRHPEVAGPPPVRDGRRGGAAPGIITTPPLEAVRSEFARARRLAGPGADRLQLIVSGNGRGNPGSASCIRAFVEVLGITDRPETDRIALLAEPVNADTRMERQVRQLSEFTRRLVRRSKQTRDAFWTGADRSSLDRWVETTRWYRAYLWEEVIGALPEVTDDPKPRSRLTCDEPEWRGYDVMLDVLPDVFASGILCVPKNLQPHERRPLVIVQHGLEGRASHGLTEDGAPFRYYQAVGRRLLDRGFIVYLPQNPYIGGDDFRVLNRKANPLKLQLWSFIVRQYEQALSWLETLPFVDPDRIALYGLSYGGKTAMRVPAVLHECFAAVICSGDFNEWNWKMTSITQPFSYMYTQEYEMFTFDLGNTFNYAELAGLIAPVPFMVERGHRDGVAIDEWVAYEYAAVRRLYENLGIGDRTAIEYFDGPHQIHGVGTFRFLHEHLNWPEPNRRD